MEAHSLLSAEGVRVAIEGCGHGTLNAIYDAVRKSSKVRGWDGVDVLIIGGDFQAVRNSADLTVMSVPAKYRQLGDFHDYYAGRAKAPYLTIFIGGNHEAAAHMAELYYGGWVAPNIYYLGAANVLRLGPLRIAGMSGVWKEHYYNTTHEERLPFRRRDVKSFYSVREEDVRKLLLLREPVDIGLSHDWPLGIERLGDSETLLKYKPHFKSEMKSNTLGNPAAEWVMNRLRPAYWFSAHLHTNFTAVKQFDPPGAPEASEGTGANEEAVAVEQGKPSANPDEIDLDDADDIGANPDEIDLEDAEGTEKREEVPAPSTSTVSDELRAQLPASFAKPDNTNNTNNDRPIYANQRPGHVPGQPVPPTITNRTTRFLALNKCLPGRQFLTVMPIQPLDAADLQRYPPSSEPGKPRYTLSYDAEWLAIQRVFAPGLQIGVHGAAPPADLGEAAYRGLVDRERAWVDEHVVRAGRLAVPRNFEWTAPPHRHRDPTHVKGQPDEYSNPQTAAYCALIGVENRWHATDEERAARKAAGPTPEEWNAGEYPDQGGGAGAGGEDRGSTSRYAHYRGRGKQKRRFK
ncbi:lariat debranching enzyme, C-terminal domain-containing protein [Biscogniauxia mediterranea]|nr:lariat debranching enzyme, C-terminal domain-containing protein [Biscogniauxia mediterranea]